MTRLRYVKDLAASAAPSSSAVRHAVRSIRARYETDPAVAAALLPRPLTPAERPEIFVQFADLTMHLPGDRVMKLGAATVGVACTFEGAPGCYVLAMPMEGEFVVIGGREKYGEPKKIAQTHFELEGDRVRARVRRKGIDFLELGGRIAEPNGAPLSFTEHFYCFKALPAAQPEKGVNGGFDGDVLLTRLVWERNYTSRRAILDGEVIVRESPYDPLADVPVRRLVSMEFVEGATRTSGEVVRAVPGEWFAPFLCQRYDDIHTGIALPSAEALHA